MCNFIFDRKADRRIPGGYFMVSFTAFRVTRRLKEQSCARRREGITGHGTSEALAACRYNRVEDRLIREPEGEMARLASWLPQTNAEEPRFVSDNTAFDCRFLKYYLSYCQLLWTGN